jgi:GT2 family glycosyltransferase
MLELAVLIPTLGRPTSLARVLDRLDRQTLPADNFEVIVVADAQERDLAAIDSAVSARRYATRRLQARAAGASAARNTAWRAAQTPLILFIDDDVLPSPQLLAEHLSWHHRHPSPNVGVLGQVRWADEVSVTPFMRWLENGIQFDYPNIDGIDAGWGRFYTANASVKRAAVERVGGFNEVDLPFGYEDLDLALRMRDDGFVLLYNRDAVAEHLHVMDLEYWKRRMARIAISERKFCEMHPEVPPYFFDMFSAAAAAPRAHGRGERLARFISPRVPWLGSRVWRSADSVYRQALAEPFLTAWHDTGESPRDVSGADLTSSG